jgi:hypothetical protein
MILSFRHLICEPHPGFIRKMSRLSFFLKLAHAFQPVSRDIPEKVALARLSMNRSAQAALDILLTEFESSSLTKEHIRDCFLKHNCNVHQTFRKLAAAARPSSNPFQPFRTGANLNTAVPTGRPTFLKQPNPPPGTEAWGSLADAGKNERGRLAQKLRKPLHRNVDFHGIHVMGAKQVILRELAGLNPDSRYNIWWNTGKGLGSRDGKGELRAQLPDFVERLIGYRPVPIESNKGVLECNIPALGGEPDWAASLDAFRY